MSVSRRRRESGRFESYCIGARTALPCTSLRHMPGFEETSNPVANQHAFLEFSIDRERRVLTEKWRYTLGPEWPHAKGMAIRLPNGNTLANYGTGGTIREITSDLQTAWQVKFDTPGANDFYNKMVGNNVLIDDLYRLNGGGPE